MIGRTALALGMALAAVPAAWSAAEAIRWDAAQAVGAVVRAGQPDQPAGQLDGVVVMASQEDLVERPYFAFDGKGAHIRLPDQPALNPDTLTLSAWFRPAPGTASTQKAIAAKSRPTHHSPWYQYGLFILDTAEHPAAVCACLSVRGTLLTLEAPEALLTEQWNFAALTFDGEALRLFVNGTWYGPVAVPAGRIEASPTPLLFGAYENLPKTDAYGFQGAISVVSLAAGALPPASIEAAYLEERGQYPLAAASREESVYERDLNAALGAGRDLWGEALIAAGGATYDGLKDRLRPVFYSTGRTNKDLGVHNLLFAAAGGEPPYLVPLADGSRVLAGRYDSGRYLEIGVGAAGQETYGSVLDDLDGPRLGGGWYPMLHTGYRDRLGIAYRQECFAATLPGMSHQVAFMALRVEGTATAAAVEIRRGEPVAGDLAASCAPTPEAGPIRWQAAAGETLYLIWSPRDALPAGIVAGPAAHAAAQERCRRYWDDALSQGQVFDVPEALVMDAQRNLLVQNLILRWRYSLGSVVYHDAFYQPEGNDAAATLALYGHTAAARESLARLLDLSKGPGSYVNWERGEKLSHGAHYYHLTRDVAFIQEHTALYESYAADFAAQLAADPHGLLQPERQCGDIPTPSYALFHQAVCWRGLRDMAEVWGQVGRGDLRERYAPIASRWRQAIRSAVEKTSTSLPDDSLFVGLRLLEPVTVHDPITATRLGSYWNLCMPYAFASGLWSDDDPALGRILDFVHGHGGVMLGLMRFNYYPTRIGSHRPDGLPGYYTTGFDNVYLPSYLQLLSQRDQADRLVLSFYGRLAHGMTRGTFVSGEGDSGGARPDEFFRSTYGGPCSGNNVGLLLALRLMLVRESNDDLTGQPRGLFLAHATPRPWLADGQSLSLNAAPTCFGPVSCSIVSELSQGRIHAEVAIPERAAPATLRLRLRTPGRRRLVAVTVNGAGHDAFDPADESIDLSGQRGRVRLTARYE